MKEILWTIWDQWLDLLFPSNIYCISCGMPIDGKDSFSLCNECKRTLNWTNRLVCQRCGKPMRHQTDEGLCQDCAKEPRPFQQGFTCVQYGRAERDIIHRLKYYDRADYHRPLGELMAERLLATDVQVDLVVPVPMYKAKEKRRGYNQAALLAQCVARERHITYVPHLLLRTRDTLPMSGMGEEERRKNVENLFQINPKQMAEALGRTVLLVDDVFTTGSTASACSEVLLNAGANAVFVLTFASGADRNPI